MCVTNGSKKSSEKTMIGKTPTLLTPKKAI